MAAAEGLRHQYVDVLAIQLATHVAKHAVCKLRSASAVTKGQQANSDHNRDSPSACLNGPHGRGFSMSSRRKHQARPRRQVRQTRARACACVCRLFAARTLLAIKMQPPASMITTPSCFSSILPAAASAAPSPASSPARVRVCRSGCEGARSHQSSSTISHHHSSSSSSSTHVAVANWQGNSARVCKASTRRASVTHLSG